MSQSEIKICQNCQGSFTIDTQDFDFYKKIQVPSPTWCPECRMVRRFLFRNERCLYRCQCQLCGQNILSNYPIDQNLKIYCSDCWWSDKWDGEDYKRDYDFNKSFFEQFREFFRMAPLINLWGFDNTGAEYANYSAHCRNIYSSVSIVGGENVYYSGWVDKSKDIFDCYGINESELIYEDIDCDRIYSSFFLIKSSNCINSWFLFDCANCQNCFLCSNLRHKEFYIRNKPYSREDYYRELEKMNLGSFGSVSSLAREFKVLSQKSLNKFAQVVKSVNCVGNEISNSKNIYKSFFVNESENCRYSWRLVVGMKDVFDISGAYKSELV